MSNKQNCSCTLCTLVEEGFSNEEIIKYIQQKEEESLIKHGFFIHKIHPTNDYPTGEYHTHGLWETRDHVDFQIVLPMHEDIAFFIFSYFAEQIRRGRMFKTGMKVQGIIKDYPVKLIAVRQEKRNVLRILIPDEKGLFPEQTNCNTFYARQLQYRFFKTKAPL